MTMPALPLEGLHPRRPLAALLLSLALPGLGQLYNGELNKALWLFLAFVLVGVPGITLVALVMPSALMLAMLCLSVLVTLGIWLGAAFDAWRQARRRQIYSRAPWQISGVYALVFLAAGALLFPALIGGMRERFVQSFYIPSGSMEPTLTAGDFLFADKRYNCPGCKSRVAIGDIGIFVYPNDRTVYYIKRVIGLPGDHVTIAGRAVTVNGVQLGKGETSEGERILVTEGSGEAHWQVAWRKDAPSAALDLIVPPGQIFLLGDNRDASTDSRKFGTVPLSDLIGKARQIWFSRGPEGVRWERLGKVVE